MAARRRLRGLTLVELLAVIAIIAIVTTLAVPGVDTFIQRRRLEGWANHLAGDLRYLRSEAVARNRSVRWGWHRSPEGTCYVLHTGPSDACTCAPAGPTTCSEGGHAIKTVDLPAEQRVRFEANVKSIVFDPVHGTATPAGTLRLTSDRIGSIHHVVNILGRVRTCSPAGSLPNYPSC